MTVITLGFEVLTAVSTKMAVFWVVAPSSLVEVYQRFRGPCCLHHQGDEAQKTAVFVITLFLCEVFRPRLGNHAQNGNRLFLYPRFCYY
jgi:hypothetical protein